MSDVTRILQAVGHYDGKHASELLPLVYDELRRLAAYRMTHEAPGQTLQATALVHEVWLRLTVNEDVKWEGREHFFAAAAEAMRRIMVDRARAKLALKRGGNLDRVNFDGVDLALPAPEEELLEVNEALDRLAAVDTCAAEIVTLCFFVGLTQEAAARELRVSLAKAERRWAFARAWLLRELKRMRAGPENF